MDQSHPKFIIEYTANVIVAILADENILEEAEIRTLENDLLGLIEKTDAIKLVINFDNVKFLSSSVLGILIRISKKVFEAGGELRLCCINPKIFEIFKITRLNKVFYIHDTQAQAEESFD